jgi:DNA-binding transcriptional ArsR family regulator
MKRHHLSDKQFMLDLETVLDTFKALSEAPRIRLIIALRTKEQTVSSLVDILDLPQSTVSRHLAILRVTKLVTTRRKGTHIYYTLKSSHIGDLVLQAFSHAEHERHHWPDHPKKSKPQRKGVR